jgi:hypothetical protein
MSYLTGWKITDTLKAKVKVVPLHATEALGVREL